MGMFECSKHTIRYSDELESVCFRTRLFWVIRFSRVFRARAFYLFIAYCLHDVVRMDDSNWLIHTHAHVCERSLSKSRWNREAAFNGCFSKNNTRFKPCSSKRKNTMIFSLLFKLVYTDVSIWIEWLTEWMNERRHTVSTWRNVRTLGCSLTATATTVDTDDDNGWFLQFSVSLLSTCVCLRTPGRERVSFSNEWNVIKNAV